MRRGMGSVDYRSPQVSEERRKHLTQYQLLDIRNPQSRDQPITLDIPHESHGYPWGGGVDFS